jgi:hypothetical protein
LSKPFDKIDSTSFVSNKAPAKALVDELIRAVHAKAPAPILLKKSLRFIPHSLTSSTLSVHLDKTIALYNL